MLLAAILGSLIGSVEVVRADHDTQDYKCNYYRMQGLCESPRGNILDMWRDMSRIECEKRCSQRWDCASFLYAEGSQHIYTGTCEFYDGYPYSADNNNGWACYVKEDCW